MNHFGRSLSFVLLLVAATPSGCGDSTGKKLQLRCFDQAKEQELLAESKKVNAIAEDALAPFRAELKSALAAAPPTTAGRCTALPADVDWTAVSDQVARGESVNPGVTLVGSDYQRPDLPIETMTTPSRVKHALVQFNVRNGVERKLNGDFTCPDYPTALAAWREQQGPQFWTYELVVIDGGVNAPTAMSSASATASSHPPLRALGHSRAASAAPVPEPEASSDASTAPQVPPRRARAFVYDYGKKQIVCYGVCTFSGELSGQDRDAKMLVACIPALAPTAVR